jgi:hypothetical protein
MALTSAFQPASATPAADLYDAVTAIMLAASWVHVEQASASDAGNTGDAVENVGVDVWRNATSTVFLLITTDESGTAPPRLRFRCAESYTAGSDHKVQFPCPGFSSGASITPTAADAVDAGLLTIYQAVASGQKVGWVDIPVSGGGFEYVCGANADEVVLATGAVFPNWMHAGRLDGGNVNLSPSSSLVFLGGCAVTNAQCVSWSVAIGSGTGDYRTSREPNQGAVALTGAFCYATAGPSSVEMCPQAGAGGRFGVAHMWLKSFAGYRAYLHSASNTIASAAIRTHLGKLGSMALFGHDTPATLGPTVKAGDAVTIDGDLHYVLGLNHVNVNAGVGLSFQTQVICARDDAF